MAKFTAAVPLNLHWLGNEISGAAGATHRIADALVDEFLAGPGARIPGGVTWITQDETSGIPTLPLAQSDVTGLVAALAGKIATAGDSMAGTLSLKATQATIFADRYSTLAAAVAAVPALGGEVVIPAGSYTVSDAITVAGNVHVRGMGEESVLIFTGTDTATPRLFNVTGSNASFRDLTLIDERTFATNPVASVGIRFGAVTSGLVENCRMRGFSGGGISAASATALLLRGNRIDTIGSSATGVVGDGILLSSCHKSIVTENVVHHAGKHGINVSGSTSAPCVDVLVGNNLCYLNGDTGVWLQYTQRASVVGNSCFDNGDNGGEDGGQGINASDDCLDFSIVGNVVSAATEQGIVVQNSCSGFQIVGNTVRGCTWDGIAVKTDCDTFTIGNNVSEGHTLSGIFVLDSSQATIVGNTVVGNMDNGIRVRCAASAGSGFTISGNVVRDNNQDGTTNSGILIDGASSPSDVAITGNIVVSTTSVAHSRGIRLFTGQNVTVTGNVLRGNTTNIGSPETASTALTIFGNEDTASIAPTQGIASIDTTLTTAYQDLTSATMAWTGVQSENVEFLAVFDFHNSVAGNDECLGQIVVNGATQGVRANFSTPTTAIGRASVAVTFQMTIAAGVHSAKLQAKKTTGAGTALAKGTTTRFSIRRFPANM